tara:strand:+ start:551 stop:796 length:246 start_codon:yes stop_codon:yes gene_type:complete
MEVKKLNWTAYKGVLCSYSVSHMYEVYPDGEICITEIDGEDWIDKFLVESQNFENIEHAKNWCEEHHEKEINEIIKKWLLF